MTHYLQEDFYDFDAFTAVSLGENSILESIDISLVNKRNSDGWTLLMYACRNGQAKVVEELIRHGSSVRCHQLNHTTALMLAAGSGDLNVVKAVFSQEDLELTDQRGWTALFHAVFFGREICAEYLLVQGANAQVVDLIGQTPIQMAVKSGMDNMVALLLRGADRYDTSKTEGNKSQNLLSATPTRITPIKKINIFKQKRTYNPSMMRIPLVKREKENCTPIKEQLSNIIDTEMNNLYEENKALLKPALMGSNTSPPSVKRTIMGKTPIRRSEFRHSPTCSPRIFPKKNVEPTVLTFLAHLGLEKYWPIFRDEEVDFETFMTFGEENLKEIGITLYGPRRKIYMAIKEYQSIKGNDSGLLKGSHWIK